MLLASLKLRKTQYYRLYCFGLIALGSLTLIPRCEGLEIPWRLVRKFAELNVSIRVI